MVKLTYELAKLRKYNTTIVSSVLQKLMCNETIY
jgi:hypothetical protein